jgi:hypothetical protein
LSEDLGQHLSAELHWDDRDRMMLASGKAKTLPTAVRRTLLSMCQHPDAKTLLANSWLNESRLQVAQDTARFALRTAQIQGLDADVVLFEECRLLKTQGKLYEALTLLEPSEPDLATLEESLRRRKTYSLYLYFM